MIFVNIPPPHPPIPHEKGKNSKNDLVHLIENDQKTRPFLLLHPLKIPSTRLFSPEKSYTFPVFGKIYKSSLDFPARYNGIFVISPSFLYPRLEKRRAYLG